jgi:hypothetical protein
MSRAHLSDDRLIEICLLESLAPADEPHLRSCKRCETRRAEIASTLNEVTTQVIDEADAHFPADRLARQHARILQHVDRLGRPARVIAFPAARTLEPARPATRRMRRWFAAASAVAAAFVVGILTGHLAHPPAARRPDTLIASRAIDMGTPRTVVVATTSLPDDDVLLGQIEVAVGSTSPVALRALDALTPRAWDVR